MYTFYGYPKCSTCKKAVKHLENKGIFPEYIDIKLNPPTVDQLKEWMIRKRPITRYIENLQSHSTLEILFFIYNLLAQFLTMANKLLELLFLRKTLHLATSPRDR